MAARSTTARSTLLSPAPLLLAVGLGLASPAPAQDWVADLNEDLSAAQTLVLSTGDVVVLAAEGASSSVASRLMRFDSAGGVKASMNLSGLSGEIAVYDMLLRDDDTLLLSGQDWPYHWLAALDPVSMTFLWERSTLQQGVDYAYPHSMDETTSGIFLGGYSHAAGRDSGVISRYDAAGNRLWVTRIDDPADTRIDDLVGLPDGGVLVVVEQSATGVPDQLLLMKLDAFGALESVDRIQTPGFGSGILEPLPDGSMVLTCSGSGSEGWIAKLDTAGQILWQRSLSGFFTREVIPAAGGGMTLAVFDGAPGLIDLDAGGNVRWFKRILAGPTASLATGRHPDGSLYGVWLDLFADASYLGRFDADGSGAPACGAVVLNASVSTQTPSHAIIPDLLQAVPAPAVTPFLPPATLTPTFLLATPHCGDPCSSPPTFCETSPNSVGAGARIGSSGTVSVFANDLTLITTGIGANKPGIYFYSSTPVQKPFGNGTLCVGGKKKRLGLAKSDASGVLTQDFDVTGTSITPGTNWYFQCWYRDPAGGGDGTNLSDGLSTTWCP